MLPIDSKFRGLCLKAALSVALLCSAQLGAQSVADDAQMQTPGYYPTYQESGIIASGDADYMRSLGSPLQPPDLDRWAATGGIWPYEYDVSELSWLQRQLQPLDYILRPLTPGETLAIQGPTSESRFQLGAAFPFLTRTFHPEKSHVADIFGMEATQYTPLYFDVMNISLIGVYSEVSGLDDNPNVDDGFSAALSMMVRGILRLTDRTSLVLYGEVYFIITEGDVGLYVTGGGPRAFVDFTLQEEFGAWDVRFYDQLWTYSAAGVLYTDTLTDGYDIAGRERVGIVDNIEGLDWWDPENQYLVNTVGLNVGRFIGDSLRFLAGFERNDSWNWGDFGDSNAWERFYAGLFYNGYGSWLAPFVTYNLHTRDFDDPVHHVQAGVTAPITPNLSISGTVGWLSGYDSDRLTWSLAVYHNLTSRLYHRLSIYDGYYDLPDGESFNGQRLDYNIGWNVGSRTRLGLGLGWAQDDSKRDVESFDGRVIASTALWNYTRLTAYVAYLDGTYNSDDLPYDRETLLYSLSLTSQLATRLMGSLTAQYAQHDGSYGGVSKDWDEFILSLRLTRVF